jgi:hypothetical protein
MHTYIQFRIQFAGEGEFTSTLPQGSVEHWASENLKSDGLVSNKICLMGKILLSL